MNLIAAIEDRIIAAYRQLGYELERGEFKVSESPLPGFDFSSNAAFVVAKKIRARSSAGEQRLGKA